ncbi:Ig-like domain-containing protein [Streptococcus uberis]|nr:Ig-like domain-containing protein [Streptococcus uberis]MCK1238706.1 Ig-like domain-containing protein [Streptococcus uberis]
MGETASAEVISSTSIVADTTSNATNSPDSTALTPTSGQSTTPSTSTPVESNTSSSSVPISATLVNPTAVEVPPTAPTANALYTDSTLLSGIASAGDTITVTFQNGITATSIVQPDGSWSLSIPEGMTLNTGDVITIFSTNQKGLKSSLTSVTVIASQSELETPVASPSSGTNSLDLVNNSSISPLSTSSSTAEVQPTALSSNTTTVQPIITSSDISTTQPTASNNVTLKPFNSASVSLSALTTATAGDSSLTVDGKNVIESAAFNGTTNNTVNGKVVQQWTGNPLEINNPAVATPLAGVRIYAQWVEKSGAVSPIYTTVTMADGTYHIVMQDFVLPDGTIVQFDADPNFPEGEKFRIWADTPAGLQLYYSWESGQLGPQSAVMDTSFNASNAIGPNQLNNFNFIYVSQTQSNVMHNLGDATTSIPAPGETGFINGTVFWNNAVNFGAQTMGASVTNSPGSVDTPATNITVVGSYLSDYALQQIYTKAATAIGTSNIRGVGWTDANEQALQNWIKQQIAIEGTSLWIGETVTTTTDANGKYNLQFNGTYGKEWNDRGFNGLLLDSALNSNTVLPDAIAISEGLPIGSKYSDLFNHVSSSPQIGTWYGDASAGTNAMTTDAAPKHINLDWTYVSLLDVGAYGFSSPYYGNKFLFDTASTSWTNTLKVDAVADQYITGANFGLFLDQLYFDIVNFNTTITPASPGNTVTTAVQGLPSPDLGDNKYQIVWFDKNGAEVATSPVQSPSTTGTLPSADFVVPTTAQNGDVYTAKIFAINPTDDTTRAVYPLAVDSFVVSVTDATTNQPDYIDTTVGAGTSVTIAAPLNTNGTAVPMGTTFTASDPATLPSWIVVDSSGSLTVSPGVTVSPGIVAVPVTVNYPDGSSEVIDVAITVVDVTAPTITPIANVTTPENKVMTPITVQVNDSTATTTVTGLPTGVIYNPTTGQITGTPTIPGTYPITVTSTDTAGNTSIRTFTITVTPDTTVSTAQTVNPVTSEDTKVTGIGVPGNTITVTFPNGTTGTAVVQPDGTWGVPVPTGVDLVGGEVLPVTSTTPAGDVSPTTNVTVKDVTPPPAPPVNSVTSEDSVITGTGEPGDTITVKYPDGSIGMTVVKPDGTWTITIPATVDLVGGEVLPVTETDPAGNVSPVSSVTVKDTTPPAAPTVNPVTSEDTAVTGIGVPGNTITVTFPNGTTGTAVVNPDGTWSVPVPSGVDLIGGEVLPVTSTDPSGNVSPTTNVTVQDVTPPAAPPVNPVTSEDTVVTGTGVPGDTIIVKFPNGTTGAAIVQPDGTWTVTIPPSVNLVGGEVLPVTEIDLAGNVSPATSVMVKDTTPPAAPTVNPVTSEDTTVTGIGVPGNTITVTFPDGSTGTAVVQPDGTWSVPVPAGVDLVGGEVLPVTSTDPAGNVSPTTNVTVKDVTPPPAPPVNPVTSEDTVVTGTGVPGDTITVKFPDGSTGTAVVQPDGTWSVPIPAGIDLVGGEVLTATEADPAGNVSPASTVTVTDTTAPNVPTVNPVTSEDAAVTGVGTPGNTITVTFPDGSTGTAVVQPDGTWSVPVPAGVDLVGGEVLPVTSTDPAGNVSPTTNVTVKDVTPPPAPPVNPVTSEDTVVTGTGVPGDTITVKFPDGSTGTAVVQPDGTWSVVIPSGVDLKGGEVLPVVEIDPAGNVSPASSVTVTDTTAPLAPPINTVSSTSTTVTGVGEPGNTVTVTFPDGSTSTAVVQPDGTWSAPIPAGVTLSGGEIITATQTDPAGNVSPASSTTVSDVTPPTPAVNPVTSEDTVVTGTGTPGDTLTVTFPNGSTATTTVQPDGTWTVTIPAGVDLVGGEVLPVTETDPAGNSASVTVTVIDKTPPATPTVDPITSEDSVVTGIGVPGNTITVTFPNGITGTAVVNPDGTWSVPVPASEDLVGGEILPVTSTDPSGNVSPTTNVTVKDVTPPPAPPVNPVTSEDTVVTGTGVPGDTITVKFPTGTTGTAVVQSDGTWTVTIPTGVDLVGGEVLPVTETDLAGNVSGATTVTVTDTTAPDAPTVNPITSEDSVVTGIGVPGNTITVKFPDGTTGTTAVNPDGTWSIPVPAGVDLVGGEVLPVTSTDPSGNTSPTTNVTVRDVTPPPAPAVNPVTSKDPVVTGKGVPGDTITVKFPDGSTATSVVKSDGTWSVSIPVNVILVGGEILPVTETDPSGNVSPETTVVVQDVTSADAPTVNPITSEDSVVTGKGVPGNTITVTFPNGTTGTTVVQPNGTWTVSVPVGIDLVGGEVLPVTSTDPSGNISSTTNVTVKDVTPPLAPPVNPVTSNDNVITGTGVPGDTITVKFPDGTIGRGDVQPDGTWTVSIPVGIDLVGGEVLPVTETDPSGNVSEATTVTVTDTTAPDAPTVNPITSEDSVVTGKGVPGNTITVTFPNGTTGTTVVQPNGTWTVSVPVGIDLVGGEVLPVTSTDPAGNTSPTTNVTVKDVTPPPAPPVNPLTSTDSVVTGTGVPGDTITVKFPNRVTVTTIVQLDGTWTVTIPVSVDLIGGEVLPVIETDPSGNVSPATSVTVTDTTAPVVDVNPVKLGDTEVTGTSEPGTTITVTLPNGTTVTTVTDHNGNWIVPVSPLQPGETVTAVSTDSSGNTSQPSSETVPLDTTAPVVDVNPVKLGDTEVTGTSEPGTIITVILPTGTTVTTVTDHNGNWTVPVSPLQPGETVTAVSTDSSGNTSQPSSATVPLDTTAPLVDVNPVKPGDKVVTGTSEPGTIITVILPTGTTVTTVTDHNGNWTVPVSPLQPGETVTAVSTDSSGNTSQPSSETVPTMSVENTSATIGQVKTSGNNDKVNVVNNVSQLPKTGEKTNILALLESLLSIATAGLLLMNKKKNK